MQKNIISSWGAKSFINKMIIDNNDVTYNLLIHKEYMFELKYGPLNHYIPPCKKCVLIYNLDTFLNNQAILILENVMSDKC